MTWNSKTIPARKGKTLVEVAIVVSLLSVALMLSATTLVALFRLERQIQASAAHRRAVGRLSNRWRQDVHTAVSLATTDGCELALPDGRTIHYTARPREVTRETRRGNEVLHRDAYVLATGTLVQFGVRRELPRPFAELSITPAAPPKRRHQPAIRPQTVIAALDLHQTAPSPSVAAEAAP